MNYKKCTENLRAFIRHREKMHENLIFVDENGVEIAGAKINPDADELYKTMKFALHYMEENGDSPVNTIRSKKYYCDQSAHSFNP